MSLARAHRERSLAQASAAQAARADGVRAGAAATEYELMKARLGVDLRRLKEIQSIERKVELKRELIPAYAHWIAGLLEADAGGEDLILVHIMIWCLDIGDYAGAIPLAEYVLRHNLSLPERFNRTAATLIVEETADAALAAFGQGNPEAYVPAAVLDSVDAMTIGHDMHDQVRAKLEKAQGLAALAAGEALAPDADGPAGSKRGRLEIAQRRLRRALQLDPRCGVKRRLEDTEREIRKLTPPETSS